MFTLFDGLKPEKEDVKAVIRDLCGTCQGCRLSIIHPYNRGFIYRGNPEAKIAVVYEAPRDAETECGVSMVGAHGRAFEKWMRFLGLDTTTDVFITQAVQCQPPLERKNDENVQREPDKAEVSACFGPRCLRVLRAMPNLECVIVLGWFAAGCVLGFGDTPNDKPKAKTHDGQWFETSYLPGIPVFCMQDPVWVVKKPSPDKNAVIERALDYFKREFLQMDKIAELAREAQTAREEKGLGLL
jgi:uracil-DNA glycosylase family 4